jgi:hypothetical protein
MEGMTVSVALGGAAATTPAPPEGPAAATGGGGEGSYQQQRAETLSQLKERDVPIMAIGNLEVPLYGLPGFETWGFFTLLIALLSMILALVTLYTLWLERQNGPGPERAASAANARAAGRRKALRWASAAGGALAVLIFILVENPRDLMVLFDEWTPLLALVLAAQGALLWLSFRGQGGAAGKRKAPLAAKSAGWGMGKSCGGVETCAGGGPGGGWEPALGEGSRKVKARAGGRGSPARRRKLGVGGGPGGGKVPCASSL